MKPAYAIAKYVFLLLCVAAAAQAQNPADARAEMDYYLPGGVSYDPDIPTPEQVLGMVPGEWHVRHDQVVRYMDAVAQASDRVTIERTGRSYENRELLLLTITSPENHANIESIRRNHLALTQADSDNDISDMPVVLYQGYSVHGNEPSGVNAALLYVYHLAAAQGTEIERQLNEAVILVDPAFNPDGMDRFANWVNSRRGIQLSTDPENLEQNEPWPGGRTNHYWFDLNRDWLPLQHPESIARLQSYYRWRPNVLTDHHEMGSDATFFFQPGIPSRTHPITPQRNQELTGQIAEFHADILEADKRLFYTRESFDDFYYGKGSTYPDVTGGVGILFEQASSRGHARETENGILRFPFTIQNQFLASLSTLEGAVSLREELLSYQRAFYEESRELAADAEVRAYVFGDARDRASAYRMAEILRRHQIDVYTLASDVEAGDQTFEAGGAYVVPLAQDQFRLIESVFEYRTEFPDNLFYDISTWTFPSAFNTPVATLSGRQFGEQLLGAAVEVESPPRGMLESAADAYLYAFEWDEFYAPRAAFRLLDAGVRARVASEPFTAQTQNGQRRFDYGTILVAAGPQDVDGAAIRDLMQTIAEQDGIDVSVLNGGLSVDGVDLGSRTHMALRKPEVAIAVGDGVRSSEAGEAWHVFDQKHQIPVSLLTLPTIRDADLDRYNVLVLPSGNYNSLPTDKIKEWVSAGGTLIVYKTALSWAAREEIANITLLEPEDEDAGRRPYASQEQVSGEQLISGSIFNAELDLTHPLGYGYNHSGIKLFRDNAQFMAVADNPYATPLVYTDDPLSSGYISEQNLEKIAGTAAVVVSRHGSGRVIAMTDNPNFRAFWYGTTRLFMNAVFFGHTINAATTE
ncbi:M14 family metallopeptidase [Pseudohongiella sp. SYSU M77423]|uniref:M14 metallopeptidase family protein n=1 Tax=Pseudohongiella sp. SYSU M77423 TaxID=3042312 RepID=UPI0024815DB5|nr:M14 metallopeptidase family protein [Pseudohongiella sp. SYSU M77423]MDH7943814.1 M14 family metallopeptidase [Pseudohongiella sp. SYSU M77423]MEC8861268.1 M14 metallopeptidase family protein [Pseudomonadota bacterium]